MTESTNPGKKAIFIGIGVVLLGLIAFGVVLAKNRVDFYGNQNNTTDNQEQNDPEISNDQPPAPEHDTQNVAGAEQTSNDVVMPAAGAKDVIGGVVIVTIVTYAVVGHLQSQRKKIYFTN